MSKIEKRKLEKKNFKLRFSLDRKDDTSDESKAHDSAPSRKVVIAQNRRASRFLSKNLLNLQSNSLTDLKASLEKGKQWHFFTFVI